MTQIDVDCQSSRGRQRGNRAKPEDAVHKVAQSAAPAG
jgi:hypothetical protein